MSDTTTTLPEVLPVPTPVEAVAPTPDFRTTGSTTATDLRRELSDVLKFVESDVHHTVAITRHGKVVAAVVGGTEFKLLERLKASAAKLAPKLGLSFEAFLASLVTEKALDASSPPATDEFVAPGASLFSDSSKLKEGDASGLPVTVTAENPANAAGAVTGNGFES